MENATQSEIRTPAIDPANPLIQNQAGSSASSIDALSTTYVLPASLEQTRYWMLARLDPTSTASNMAISFDVDGPLDRVAAEAAIAALTLRHEALRTLFRLDAGILSQVIVTRPLYSFSTEDLSPLPFEDREQVLAASLSRHSHTVIDLERGPVLHAHLIHLDGLFGRRHVLALTLHHIVCDGWSNGILVRDFTILYENLRAGRPEMEGLATLPFQFADFALWQSEYLASPAAEQAAAFWRRQFTGNLYALDMPSDHPRTPGRSFPGDIESALLPQTIHSRLTDYCRTTGSTKHIVLLTAFEAFCSIYTGQDRFLLGSTIANRTQPGMEDVVGRFANPQIIYAHVDPDLSFAALEQRVRAWETEAYQYQELPFSRIIEDIQLDQAGGAAQFLQVWFLYQKAFMQPQNGATICVTPRRSVSGGVDFDLLVSVVERAEGPRIQCEYNTLLFSPGRIRAFINGYIRFLDAALLHPARALSANSQVLSPAPDLPPDLSSGATLNLAPNLLPSFAADANVGTPDDQRSSAQRSSFLSCVEHHKSCSAHAVACAAGDDALTWQELDERSKTLAVLLRETFPHATTVALVLAPAVESLVALLAVMRLGLDLIPLPAHATEDQAASCMRRFPQSVMLAPFSSKSSASLTFAAFPRTGLSAKLVAEPMGATQFHFLSQADPVLFRTLSTEAVFARTKQALSSIHPSFNPSINSNGHNSESLSFLCFPPLSPMAACFDLLLALVSGGQLDLLDFPAGLQIADAICSCFALHEPDFVLITPAQAKALASSGWRGDRRARFIVRDARLPAPLAASLTFRHRSAVYLFLSPIAGGPVALQALSRAQAAHGIQPIGGSSLILTSEAGVPLPHGARGEVCLRDRQGNLQQTGLLAQSDSAGVIRRVEPADSLVAFQGHRIPLGDIEDVAYAFPSVRNAVATVTAIDTESRLVLYLEGRPTADADSTRNRFAEILPMHLAPSDVLWLERLPFLADGRPDLARLPRRETVSPAAADANSQPSSDVEQKLASIWKDVLGLKSLDPQGSFFELGGSSLSLVRLFARINKSFGTALPITTIFDAPTLSALAGVVAGRPQFSHLVQVQASGSRRPLFMVHSYLLYQGLSSSLGPDQPFYGLRELEEDRQLKIEQRVQRYVEEIRRVQPDGPYCLAGWCAAGPLTVELARQLIQSGQEISYLALFDAWLPGYVESLDLASKNESWLSYKGGAGRLGYHRNKMQGMTWSRKLGYSWSQCFRMIKEARYRFYLSNWQRLHRLSQRYSIPLPQFLHNTSFETFSALKEYQNQRVPIRLTLIRARDAREIPGASASCGWEQIAEHGVDVIWAPGDHETMFTGEHLKVTSDIVRRGLDAADISQRTIGNVPGTLSAANQKLGVLHVDCPST